MKDNRERGGTYAVAAMRLPSIKSTRIQFRSEVGFEIRRRFDPSKCLP